MLLLDRVERVPKELRLTVVVVEARRAETTADSFDLVRGESEVSFLDLGGLGDCCLVVSVVLALSVRRGGIRGLEAVRVVVRTGHDARLVLTVAGGRDERAHAAIDRERVEVGATETRDLRVEVREVAKLQHRVVRVVDSGHDVGCAVSDLLGLGEVIGRVAVQSHRADPLDRDEFLQCRRYFAHLSALVLGITRAANIHDFGGSRSEGPIDHR